MNLEGVLIRKLANDNQIKKDVACNNSYLLLLNQYFDEMKKLRKPASNILLFFYNRYYYDSSIVYNLPELVNELKKYDLYRLMLEYLENEELSTYLDLIKEEVFSTDEKLDLFISKLVNLTNPKTINSIMMIARNNVNLETLYNKFIEFKYCGQTLLDCRLQLLQNLDDTILSDIFLTLTKDQIQFLIDQTEFDYHHKYDKYVKICRFAKMIPLSKFRYNWSMTGWYFSSKKRANKDKVVKELFDYTK